MNTWVTFRQNNYLFFDRVPNDSKIVNSGNKASYTIDGIPIFFSADGVISFGPAATNALNTQKELAEIDSITKTIANIPEFRVVGAPPTEKESKLPGYKGYPDYFDVNYVAAAENKEALPPLMSKGWISLSMLSEIEGVSKLGNSNANIITIGKYVGFEMVRVDINLTAEYKKATDGDFTLSDIRIKKYKGTMYLNIEDLITAGLIEFN